MTLDRDAERFLSRLNRLNKPPLGTVPVADLRMAQWFELNRPDAEDALVQVEKCQIETPEGSLRVWIYRPPTFHGGICVYLHGGGWVLGSVETHDSLVRRLSRTAGCVMVSVDYRLAPEHPFPAAVNDASWATEWAASHRAELTGSTDPVRSKLAIAGDSAGANLAAVVCQRAARRMAGPKIDAQLLFYPVTDRNFDRASYLKNVEGYFLSRADMQWFWNLYSPCEQDRHNPECCPLHGEFRDLPPARVITAGYDPLADEGRDYAAKLQAAGIPTEFEHYPGMIHGFVKRFEEFAAGREEIEKAGAFLRSIL